MLMLIMVVAAVAAARGALSLARLVGAVPRRNADFELPGVA